MNRTLALPSYSLRWMTTLIVIAMASIPIVAVDAQQPPSSLYDGRSAWWRPFARGHSHTYRHLEGYAERPDRQTLESITVLWEPSVLDALGNYCTLRGRLYYVPVGSDEPQPVDWFQGIALYLARYPDAAPDWSHGTTAVDSLFETATVEPSGEFEIVFDVRETWDDRALAETFQCGLALANHTSLVRRREVVDWGDETPVIASSVHRLEIPAAPELAPALEMVNRATGWPFDNPNGVHLIRAVNALHALGKDEALATLEEYLTLLESGGSRHGDEKLVFWIIRTLFEPIEVGDRIPPPMIAVLFGYSGDVDVSAWPLDPMGVVADVPFMLGRPVALGGREEMPQSHIHWARRHGVLRDAPLHPTTNPLVAAEIIVSDPGYQQALGDDDDFWKEREIRNLQNQAMAMVEGLLPPLTADIEHDVEYELQWRNRVEQSIELGITWDADRQEFVIPESE